MQEHRNEFELTVSPLPPGKQSHGRRESRLLLAPSRRVRAALVAGLLALLVLVLFAGTAGQGQLVALRARFSPTPTATLPATDTVINVVHWAPWGRLLANGHPVAQLSIPSSQLNQQLNGAPTTTPYMTSFALPRGHYTLDYRADPFPPLRCAISVPAARGDDCPLARDVTPGERSGLTPGARMLDFHAAPEDLAASDYVALVKAVRATLATSFSTQVDVEPGEHYLDANGQVAIARQPLLATANFGLSPDAGSPANAHVCAILCAAPLGDTENLRSGVNQLYSWIGATVRVRMTYRYATMDGRVVLDNAPVTQAPPPSFSFPIALSWSNGAWHVAAQTFGMQVDLCPLAGNVGYSQSNVPAMVALGQSYPLINWLDGCVVAVASAATGRDGVVPLLYRFGVVLALSRQAQQVFPNLPVPDAYEQQLAVQVYTP